MGQIIALCHNTKSIRHVVGQDLQTICLAKDRDILSENHLSCYCLPVDLFVIIVTEKESINMLKTH